MRRKDTNNPNNYQYIYVYIYICMYVYMFKIRINQCSVPPTQLSSFLHPLLEPLKKFQYFFK